MDPNIIIQQQPPQPVESDMERLDRYQREEVEKSRQQEPNSVRSARAAHESAQARLARVTELGRGFRNYSHEEREAATKDAAEKESQLFQAQNAAARAQRLGKLEAARQAERDRHASEQETARVEAETQLRASYLARWKAGGGDDKGFNASWESIKAEHYKAQMNQKGSELENSLRAASLGKF